MAKRTVRVELEIEVRDLTEAEAEFGGFEDSCEGEVNETSAMDVAGSVVALFYDEAVAEAFAGSNMGVTFAGEPLVIRAEWN